LAMLIAITGSQILSSPVGVDTSESQTKLSDAITGLNKTYPKQLPTIAGLRNPVCSISSVHNASNNVKVSSGNWTATSNNATGTRANTNCYLAGSTKQASRWSMANVHANYTYTFERTSTGGTLINETMIAVSSVPDNFSLWLVVGGLVVVIGLIAFVILTLRGTGMMGGGGSGGNDYIGNA